MNNTVVSKEELISIVNTLAWANGFQIREDMKFDWIPYIEDEDVNFTFHRHFDFDGYRQNGKAYTSFHLNVSVKRMGGTPTIKELCRTADRIRSAVSIMEEFNSRNYAVEEA